MTCDQILYQINLFDLSSKFIYEQVEAESKKQFPDMDKVDFLYRKNLFEIRELEKFYEKNKQFIESGKM